jgi:hypothetical protein
MAATVAHSRSGARPSMLPIFFRVHLNSIYQLRQMIPRGAASAPGRLPLGSIHTVRKSDPAGPCSEAQLHGNEPARASRRAPGYRPQSRGCGDNEASDLTEAPTQLPPWIVGYVPQQFAQLTPRNRTRRKSQVRKESSHLARSRQRQRRSVTADSQRSEHPHVNRTLAVQFAEAIRFHGQSHAGYHALGEISRHESFGTSGQERCINSSMARGIFRAAGGMLSLGLCAPGHTLCRSYGERR